MNWVKGRNILHLGESTVDALLSLDGPVAEIDDLYKLTVEDIAKATGSFATARKILESLEKSKTCTAAQFIGNLGIPGIGESEAQKALDGRGVSIDGVSIDGVSIDGVSIDGDGVDGIAYSKERATEAIGPERGKKLCQGIEKRRELIDRLLTHLTLTAPKKGRTDGVWAGKTYCITGSGELPRESVKDIINKAGGVWKSSVVNGLDYLICNEEGTTKAKAASAKGVTVITEQQALDMAGYK
jgi:DNA ligase (NAD+)